MEEGILIIEKPDWVSWDDIKKCMMDAHASNRAKGINMSHYQWPAEQIKEAIGPNGIMLVALDKEKIVGTAAILEKYGHTWYARGRYAYMGFAGVLPEYNGKGIYKALTKRREEIAAERGYAELLFDTHSRNKHVQNIALKNGYRKVSYFLAKSRDHEGVIMVKWLSGCPYSAVYISIRYALSMFRTRLNSLYLHLLKK